jgi:hypothetical protein
MRTQAVKDYIRKHEALFWYTPEDKSEKVTDSLLVETILNYGTLDDVHNLFEVMGLQQVAQLFFQDINLSERRRNNYHELTRHYFTLFFNRYA